ncbi:hypothetical protein CJF31_00000324 [Rutstroemia sp. NJR-2017a BVV2]|nr:hypothetical protein CJF31_00000324 [Rutstroemia sp. NJR-2017a BVV2]
MFKRARNSRPTREEWFTLLTCSSKIRRENSKLFDIFDFKIINGIIQFKKANFPKINEGAN